MLHDWVSQRREVVRFEGDTGRPLTHISREVPISDFSPPSMEIPHIGGLYLRAISLYTTCIFAVVAAMSLVYGASVWFQVLGRNLCRFNRVAGFVWIGRTLLLVRGMTSVIYLSTSNLSVTNANGLVFFTWQPRSMATHLKATHFNMANNFWWPTFNSCGTQAFLGNWFTKRMLVFGPNNAINNPDDITLRKDGDLMLYNSSSSPVSILALHMKAIQFSILNSIPLAIDDLRRMATRVHVAVASQSILLARLEPDVPMANTTARQLRCSARYASSGAVYLETALRNIANSDFFACFGGDFNVATRQNLVTEARGRRWLATLDNQNDARTTTKRTCGARTGSNTT
ncbi:hypothetical protein DYB25_013576 [Aphanomyces astaci]|uniref:Uncharacterized protein n=1 Tax=Aphanomyces astaci TaxID=112090 RepID=A0A397A101_APHAT|nr:hypothetical protein DYB25_013576 [Aphanomyces astaci]